MAQCPHRAGSRAARVNTGRLGRFGKRAPAVACWSRLLSRTGRWGEPVGWTGGVDTRQCELGTGLALRIDVHMLQTPLNCQLYLAQSNGSIRFLMIDLYEKMSWVGILSESLHGSNVSNALFCKSEVCFWLNS